MLITSDIYCCNILMHLMECLLDVFVSGKGIVTSNSREVSSCKSEDLYINKF